MIKLKNYLINNYKDYDCDIVIFFCSNVHKQRRSRKDFFIFLKKK